MWDVTPVTNTRTDSGKEEQYSVWTESAILYEGRPSEKKCASHVYIVHNGLFCPFWQFEWFRIGTIASHPSKLPGLGAMLLCPYDTYKYLWHIFLECVRGPTFYQNQKLRRKLKNGPQSRQLMTWHWTAFVVLATFRQMIIFEHPFKRHTHGQRTFFAIAYLAFLSLPFVVE